MAATIEKLDAMRQQLRAELVRLETEKVCLINDIKTSKDRKRTVLKEIEKLTAEKNKVADSYNGVREKTGRELARIADSKETLEAEAAESLAIINKEKEGFIKLQEEGSSAVKKAEKQLSRSKSQLRQNIISILKSLNSVSVDTKNSMEVLQAISEGL